MAVNPSCSEPVLFLGDINVDIIMGGLATAPQPDREVTCRSFDVTPGSSAFLAAAAYAGLGGRACFAGLAGRDEYGDFMLREMRRRGINVSRVQRTTRVGTGVTVNLVRGAVRTQITYPGTIAALDGGTLDERTFRGCRHVHFAGPYLQTGLRPHLARLLRTARGLGLTVSLDPQWDATGKWTGLRRWLPMLDFFLPNAAEASSITGRRTPAAAVRALARHTCLPVVKDGRRGAWLMRDGRSLCVPGFRVRIVDNIGAGDVFDAAFLFAVLDRRRPLADAVRFAHAAAARSCRSAGGVGGAGSEREVLDFMEENGA